MPQKIILFCCLMTISIIGHAHGEQWMGYFLGWSIGATLALLCSVFLVKGWKSKLLAFLSLPLGVIFGMIPGNVIPRSISSDGGALFLIAVGSAILPAIIVIVLILTRKHRSSNP